MGIGVGRGHLGSTDPGKHCGLEVVGGGLGVGGNVGFGLVCGHLGSVDPGKHDGVDAGGIYVGPCVVGR